jgi:peptidyl-prolyl cis-trans isomerase C
MTTRFNFRFLSFLPACLFLIAGPHAVQAGEFADWVARKGNSTVTLEDIDAQLDALPEAIRVGMMNDPQRIEKLIEDLLLNRQIADLAREAGLDRNPLHPAKIRLAEDRFLSQEYTERMEHGLGDEQLEALARERFLVASPATYGGRNERRDLQHILVSFEGRSVQDARTLAEDIHARLRRGESFDALVQTYSADRARTDEQGLPKTPGFLGGIERGQTDPDFEAAAFALRRPGDLSEPAQTQHGFHIIKLVQVHPESRLPFEQVRDAVMAETARWLTRKKRDDLVTDLRSLPVEGNRETISKLPTRYGTLKPRQGE